MQRDRDDKHDVELAGMYGAEDARAARTAYEAALTDLRTIRRLGSTRSSLVRWNDLSLDQRVLWVEAWLSRG